VLLVLDLGANAALPKVAAGAPIMVLGDSLSSAHRIAPEDGWVHLGEVGKRVTNLAPDFDPRTYGHAKLSDLVLKTGSFDVDRPEGRGVRIRLKQIPKEKPARPSEAPVKHRPL